MSISSTHWKYICIAMHFYEYHWLYNHVIYTVVDFYLLMVLASSLSTANHISTPIHAIVDFRLLMALNSTQQKVMDAGV